MENKVLGLHHITAIADNAKRNHEFYTTVLGLRLVKKTVNFDDPSTYHFYYGNENGTPGTILTFFPWEGIGQGKNGAGMATDIGFAVPENSLDSWKERFNGNKIPYKEEMVFGEQQLSFADPDGLKLSLIIPRTKDERTPWQTAAIAPSMGIKGFHNATLTLRKAAPTAKVLTELLGYRQTVQEGNRYRFTNENIDTANHIDIIEDANAGYGRNAAGTNHHIAFRVKDDTIQMELREKIASAGLNITPQIDRDYFYSLYFREPGGVLFEIATDNPGFTRDEPLNELGTALKLPKQYEGARAKIESILPKL
ncbi:diguanylate cyclase [Niabella ginsenosidivorans]|uniref:Diguanylate cyclase n=1 Tax=Niabella ginsenosidivorans TaxID=1176587 RepID=A0A1A9I605_9BACT|nr:ring-cleaving dioxygenase [Niabella ginsenosidivorans]ANH82775.1 diguanylate cyclase [Niabella ginsenosidivorans]